MKILNLEMLDNCLFSPQISANKLVTIALNVKIFFKENDIQNGWIFGKIQNGLWSHPHFRKFKLHFLKIHAQKALFQTVQNVWYNFLDWKWPSLPPFDPFPRIHLFWRRQPSLRLHCHNFIRKRPWQLIKEFFRLNWSGSYLDRHGRLGQAQLENLTTRIQPNFHLLAHCPAPQGFYCTGQHLQLL